MIVLADYKQHFWDDITIWGYYNSDNNLYMEYDPEDMPVVIADTINNATKGEEIYIQHLDMYYKDILQCIYMAGYNPVSGNPPLKKMREKQFKYLISGDSNCYHITIKHKKHKVVIYNITALTMVKDRDTVIKSWGNDVHTAKSYTIASYNVLSIILQGTSSKKRPLTMGGAARRDWSNMIGFWEVRGLLKDCNKSYMQDNKTSFEKFLRPAYHGGLTLYDSEKTATETGPGYSIDCNSMYPYVMREFPLPYGFGHPFDGKPSKQLLRDTQHGFLHYFIKFKATFKIKKDGIPCIRVDNTKQMLYHERGWLTTSDRYNISTQKYIGNPNGVELTLTDIDFVLFCQNYDFNIIEYIGGIWFPATTSLFADYINKWYSIKENAQTPGIRKVSKMFLDTLSGKMATYPEVYNIDITFDKNNNLHEKRKKSEDAPPSYVHIGAFITSYARMILIGAIKDNRDRWIYSDTDSLHLLGTDKPSGVVIGTGLGEWKIEKEFDKAYYYELKQYAMVKNDKMQLTLAGSTSYAVKYIEDAYNAKGDYMKFGYSEMSKVQKDAIDTIFNNNSGDEDDLDIVANMEEENGQKLVNAFITEGLMAPLYNAHAEFIRNNFSEPFNQTFIKFYTSLHN